MQNSQRFILAIVISLAILIGWNVLFPTKIQPTNNANANANANTSANTNAAQPAANGSASQTPQSANAPGQPAAAPAASVPDTTPQRKVNINTPLYSVTLDSRGAMATSWILKKNFDPRSGAVHDIYSSGVDQNKKHLPLQLISQKGLEMNEAPLRLVTGDQAMDAALSNRNYAINGIADQGNEVNLDLQAGQTQTLEFTMRDDATGLAVSKTITFNADRYTAEIKVNLKQREQTVPQAKLSIGPNIGDQGITHFTFYSVAPEGIAAVGSEKVSVSRVHSSSINDRTENPAREAIGGPVDWAGVGDTYFAMVAVPQKRAEGLEYRTSKYEQPIANSQNKEARYLITAYVPISTDNAPLLLYTGPKDHYLLDTTSGEVSQFAGRTVDLEGLIDYGFLSTLSRPLAMPILWSIKHLRNLTSSYGIAIILFTIFIYSLFFPLKWRSSKAMKKAQKLAPRMKEIQEKIKSHQSKGAKANDAQLKELQMEQLRLMKEGNPLGGCLPLLIQMPFLFALYRAITISLDFRQASFLWLPDLSSGDPFHILEIAMAGSMMVLQLITPAPSADPVQRKMMAIGMPLFMLYMLWGAPSGLLLYWLVGNLVGFSQQYIINYLTKSSDDPEPPGEKNAGMHPTKKLKPARAS
ncbi:MAG: YidC/Oxa1 family rane protein insertase [Blastocatellia bacterium]|jgi:YidC/Oxa1 family membrane protein insertase|nr:YidC/Oxa1 family rane protein insertase [Blastocatellia bacterium]